VQERTKMSYSTSDRIPACPPQHLLLPLHDMRTAPTELETDKNKILVQTDWYILDYSAVLEWVAFLLASMHRVITVVSLCQEFRASCIHTFSSISRASVRHHDVFCHMSMRLPRILSHGQSRFTTAYGSRFRFLPAAQTCMQPFNYPHPWRGRCTAFLVTCFHMHSSVKRSEPLSPTIKSAAPRSLTQRTHQTSLDFHHDTVVHAVDQPDARRPTQGIFGMIFSFVLYS
jgi:hypothetical protein